MASLQDGQGNLPGEGVIERRVESVLGFNRVRLDGALQSHGINRIQKTTWKIEGPLRPNGRRKRAQWCSTPGRLPWVGAPLGAWQLSNWLTSFTGEPTGREFSRIFFTSKLNQLMEFSTLRN